MVARKHGALVCAHAENHGMIKWMADRLVVPRLYRAEVPRREPSARVRDRGVRASHPLLATPGSAHHAVPCLHRGGCCRYSARAWRGHQGLRRNLPAISVPDGAGPRPAGSRGRQMDVQPSSPHDVGPGRAVARARSWRPSGRLLRPRALQVRFQRQACRRRSTRISSRSRTGCPGSKHACRCSSTPWSAKDGRALKNSWS